MRLSVCGECKDKDSIWATLENKVTHCYSVTITIFFSLKQRIVDSDWPILLTLTAQALYIQYIHCKKPSKTVFHFL